MSKLISDPADDEYLVFTACRDGQTPPGSAGLVYTKCLDCGCPHGPAVLIYTKVAPQGPGSPLKFELDAP